MNEFEIFHKLFNGGNYSLPYLIRLHHAEAGDLFFINNNENVVFENQLYTNASFKYNAPNNKGEGGSLSISGIGNTLIEWVENADEHYTLEIVGLLIQSGTIQKIKGFKHFHGSISYSHDMNVEFTLDGDDRLQMSFNPYVYDTDNNRGNA